MVVWLSFSFVFILDKFWIDTTGFCANYNNMGGYLGALKHNLSVDLFGSHSYRENIALKLWISVSGLENGNFLSDILKELCVCFSPYTHLPHSQIHQIICLDPKMEERVAKHHKSILCFTFVWLSNGPPTRHKKFIDNSLFQLTSLGRQNSLMHMQAQRNL